MTAIEPLSPDTVVELQSSSPEKKPLWTGEIGDIISFEEGEQLYVLADIERPSEYVGGVWAYVDPVTGKLEGMVQASNPSEESVEVYYYGNTNQH